MNRTELFDKLLKNRFENPNGYLSMITLSDVEYGVTDENMIESIVSEMIKRDWVTTKKGDKLSIMLNYNGQQIIEKYGSYSSFLSDLIKSESKGQVKKSTDRVLNNTNKIAAIIFGFISLILTYNKFFVDNEKIDRQQTELKALNITIDSLQTELKNRHTITSIIQRVDSTKTKNINNK